MVYKLGKLKTLLIWDILPSNTISGYYFWQFKELFFLGGHVLVVKIEGLLSCSYLITGCQELGNVSPLKITLSIMFFIYDVSFVLVMGLRISIPLFVNMSSRPLRLILIYLFKFISQTLTSNFKSTEIIISTNTCQTLLHSSLIHLFLISEILILVLYQYKL